MSSLKQLLSSGAINRDAGILVLRTVVGLSMLIFHGWGKLTGGPDRWSGVGTAMENLGITFLPVFWGFMAAFSESICSALLVVGVFVRPAAALLFCTMSVAAARHLNLPPDSPSSGWSGASHAIELMAVYFALLFTGAGRYTLLRRRDRRSRDE